MGARAAHRREALRLTTARCYIVGMLKTLPARFIPGGWTYLNNDALSMPGWLSIADPLLER